MVRPINIFDPADIAALMGWAEGGARGEPDFGPDSDPGIPITIPAPPDPDPEPDSEPDSLLPDSEPDGPILTPIRVQRAEALLRQAAATARRHASLVAEIRALADRAKDAEADYRATIAEAKAVLREGWPRIGDRRP